MNTWQEGRQGGGNGYGGSPGGYGSEGEPNPYRAQNGGAPGESAPYPRSRRSPRG
ncbi:hypothetical protein GCM10020229_67150 [Kitasatospora albolonga]|uniref:hypothetical protein n=1 Tax=Kitasatospora albolonga TaxID=68173 RepID=UPI0031E62AD2